MRSNLAELQQIVADMDAAHFERLHSVELVAVRKPKTQGMRRRGAPLAEAQIAYAVQLWVNGMTQAEIAVNYGYASNAVIASKIRIFSLRYARGGSGREGERGASAGMLA